MEELSQIEVEPEEKRSKADQSLVLVRRGFLWNGVVDWSLFP